MYFVFIRENRRMNSVELFKREEGRMMEGVNLSYIVSTYVNITMYPYVQLLNANKKFF
jgi:hypothetical protein